MADCSVFKILITEEKCPPQQSNAKVGDTNFKKHFPGINKNTAWCTLEPFIRQAMNKSLFPYICEDLFCAIAKKFQDDETLSDEEMKLLTLFQDTIAYYTMYHAMPILNLTISDMGVQETHSSEGTSSASTLWRYKNTRGYIINFADDCLDQLLNYLEKLCAEDNAIVTPFKDKPCFNPVSTCLFRTTADLQECINIKNSRRTFQSMMPHINKAAKKFLLPIICRELFDLLCEQSRKGTLTPENEALLDEIRPMLANYALHMAIPHLRLNIESDGITLCSSNDGINMKKEAHDAAILDLKVNAEDCARTFRADLVTFLYENADKYPEWKDSDCYQSDDETKCLCVSSPDGCGAVMM